MKWYSGSIAEAVAHAQAQKSLFCVAIFGDDQDSTTLEASLESSEVQAIFEGEGVVAVRIGSGSEAFTQFGAIYPNVTFPSIYCITTGGVAVQVIVGGLGSAELKSRFDVAINLHREAIVLTTTSGPSSSTRTIPPARPIAAAAPARPIPEAAPPAHPIPETAPFAAQPEALAASNTTDVSTDLDLQSQSTLEERIERAKQLAAAKQRLKREEDAAEAKRRENERREAGKKVGELKRWQEEEETKRLADERRRDKQEEAALRQRLREQIAQDRIDRETRANANQAASSTASTSTATPATKAGSSSTAPAAPANYTGLARIQFRLPDGSSHTHAFEPETTVGGLLAYLSTSVVVPPQGFSIWVAFPRRELSSSEYGSTLRDLGLLPSAALLIIPNPDARILPKVGGVITMLSAVVQVLLSPLMYVWNWIRPGAAPTGQPRNTNTQRPPRNEMTRTANSPGGSSGGGQDDNLRNRGRPGRSEAERRDKTSSGESFGRTEGNIRRFHTSNSDSDDEQGTYNGNSTQQM